MINPLYISKNAILYNYLTIFICFWWIVTNLTYLKKININTWIALLLPSNLIPFMIFLIYCIPLLWVLFDSEFNISLISLSHIETSVIIILFVTIFILIGLHLYRKKVLRRPIGKYDFRKLDKVIKGKNGNELILLIALFSAFIFPFAFALRTDLIFAEGIRRIERVTDSYFLFIMIPFARIMLTIMTVISGFLYSYKPKNKLVFVPLFLDTLHYLLKLSRGSFLPTVLFFIAACLSGKKFSRWIYYILFPFCLSLGSITIAARNLASFGLQGLSTGLNQVNSDILGSVKDFFEANSMIGLISTSVRLRELYNPNGDVVHGFLLWVQTILPTPTFLGVTGESISIHKLLGLSYGVPMPTVGEIFFRMGWIGLLLFLCLGFLIGKIEGEIIRHILIYRKAYWPHILLLLSLLFGFIISFHSPSRSASRFFIYSAIFIWGNKILVQSNSLKFNK